MIVSGLSEYKVSYNTPLTVLILQIISLISANATALLRENGTTSVVP